ncbi:glutamate decarboxylase [Durotheca rogersii]|uniref:glutamate decarboxylase n=1 Tax=Durotheca rogersii TaxID=419775 RepID=UPI002220585E|nr:glutamate decarboxylase [Durotheca rogersii]KAI5863980.1 glutamate decarboxylase [Durotheca rogersii]
MPGSAETDAEYAAEEASLNRAEEVDDLLDAVKSLILPYIRDADNAVSDRAHGYIAAGAPGAPTRNVLVDSHKPEGLVEKLAFSIPEKGAGKEGLLEIVQLVLRYSVNTWDQGFLDKLYSSVTPVGVVSNLVLTVLNTNVHVYKTSPALTVIEKTTARKLANLFGFNGPRAGGITCQGGSSSNLTSLVVARNTLFPETKTGGNGSFRFALFTSEHGHYSVEKAAVACGMGSDSVVAVAVDAAGRMDPAALRAAVARAAADGRTPLYVNATAGTTVWGSYDPIAAIADVADAHGLWLHVDASWGGPAAFSPALRARGLLAGAERARSLTVNPHKMLNVPVTCSFLLAPDVAVLHRANTLRAGYLFHSDAGEEEEVWDLADLTLQCGRRGDSLNLALAWAYYGTAGLARRVERAFATAAYLAAQVDADEDLALLSPRPPPCLQVCFYYAPGGALPADAAETTRRTREIAARLVSRGFMVDYAPAPRGSLFRVVVNCETRRSTVDGLLRALREVGREVVPQ